MTGLVSPLGKRQLSKSVREAGNPSGLILYISGHTANRYCIMITWGKSCSHSVTMENVGYLTRLRLTEICPEHQNEKRTGNGPYSCNLVLEHVADRIVQLGSQPFILAGSPQTYVSS